MSSTPASIGNDDGDEPAPGDDDFLAYHRERIAELADSDAPDAWVFDQLRQSVDEDSEDGGGL